MDKILPRREWRSFGRSFSGAEARLAALPPEVVQENDEVYLLSGAGVMHASAMCHVLMRHRPNRNELAMS